MDKSRLEYLRSWAQRAPADDVGRFCILELADEVDRLGTELQQTRAVLSDRLKEADPAGTPCRVRTATIVLSEDGRSIDGAPPGAPVYGVLTLEAWGAAEELRRLPGEGEPTIVWRAPQGADPAPVDCVSDGDLEAHESRGEHTGGEPRAFDWRLD